MTPRLLLTSFAFVTLGACAHASEGIVEGPVLPAVPSATAAPRAVAPAGLEQAR